jgi:nucleotide-binding universal stress UspA family protein
MPAEWPVLVRSRLVEGNYDVTMGCRIKSRFGHIGKIIAGAKRKRCDLICMASHCRRRLAGVVLRSETHKILTHSTILVSVLR